MSTWVSQGQVIGPLLDSEVFKVTTQTCPAEHALAELMTTTRMLLQLLLVTSHGQNLETLNAVLAKMEPITTFKLDILRPGVYFYAQPLRRTIQSALGGQVVRGIYAGSATKCCGQRMGHHCKQSYRGSDKRAGIPDYPYTKSFPIGFWGRSKRRDSSFLIRPTP